MVKHDTDKDDVVYGHCRTIMKQCVITCLIALALVAPASACKEPNRTLLNRLPSTVLTKPVVAVIEPIELLPPDWVKDDNWDKTHLLKARVVEAIQGVTEGQVFVIDTGGGWNCDEQFSRSTTRVLGEVVAPNSNSIPIVVRRRFYIAGSFKSVRNAEDRFFGQWPW